MSTAQDYDAELVTAMDIITGGARRVSDELLDDRVPDGGNSYQLRHSIPPASVEDANTRIFSVATSIAVHHYLDRDPVELERDYTLTEMLTMQDAIMFHGLWIRWPDPPAYALTTVQSFWQETAGEPVIETTFARTGRVITFEIAVAINLFP